MRGETVWSSLDFPWLLLGVPRLLPISAFKRLPGATSRPSYLFPALPSLRLRSQRLSPKSLPFTVVWRVFSLVNQAVVAYHQALWTPSSTTPRFLRDKRRCLEMDDGDELSACVSRARESGVDQRSTKEQFTKGKINILFS